MEQKKQKQERVRKERAMNGQSTQKMMAFRVDLENWEYLATKANKGRFINELIAAARLHGD